MPPWWLSELAGIAGLLLTAVPTWRAAFIARPLSRLEAESRAGSRTDAGLRALGRDLRDGIARTGPVWPWWAHWSFVVGFLLVVISRVIATYARWLAEEGG